jgi:hypothetical protein
MAKRNRSAEAQRLAVFLVNLAVDSGKRDEFEKSPDAAMAAAGLSSAMVDAIKSANEAKLIEQLINLQSTITDGGKKKSRKSAKKSAKRKSGKKR